MNVCIIFNSTRVSVSSTGKPKSKQDLPVCLRFSLVTLSSNLAAFSNYPPRIPYSSHHRVKTQLEQCQVYSQRSAG